MGLLDLLNRLLVSLQRWRQGIPGPAARLYDSIVAPWLRELHARVEGEVELKGAHRVLDLGCGSGRLLADLARSGRCELLVGIDISRDMARISWRNLRREGLDWLASVVAADAHRIPLRDACLELVVSTGTLHHIKRPALVFREVVRVLRPGSEAWFYELSHDAPRVYLERFSESSGASPFIVRLVAALHGLPRSAYEAGYVKRELSESGVEYEVLWLGAITKLVVKAVHGA